MHSDPTWTFKGCPGWRCLSVGASSQVTPLKVLVVSSHWIRAPFALQIFHEATSRELRFSSTARTTTTERPTKTAGT